MSSENEGFVRTELAEAGGSVSLVFLMSFLCCHGMRVFTDILLTEYLKAAISGGLHTSIEECCEPVLRLPCGGYAALLCNTRVCVGTSSTVERRSIFGSTDFEFPFAPFATPREMASRPSSPGAAVVDDFADYLAMAGLDLVLPTSSTAPSASSVVAAPVSGVGSSAGPPVLGEPSAMASHSPGGALDGEFAAPPTLGEPALVEPATGDEDIAPPVMGVPSSSEDEEELIADPAGAPMVGAPPAAGETADVGVQTSQNVIIPAFDMVDVAAQTDGKVAFSSFVGDTPQAALATAIRALSPGSLFRLDGALRQALAQPLVDVAPSLQGGGSTSPVPPDLDLLGDTPGEQTASSGGIVDPGPGPASARIFWEEQNATVVAEQAAARPLPDDDFDAPATALEAYLKDQDSAAGQTASPSSSGQPPSSSKSPGGTRRRRHRPWCWRSRRRRWGRHRQCPTPTGRSPSSNRPRGRPSSGRRWNPEQAPPTATAAAPSSSSAASSSGPVVAAPEDTAPEPKASTDDARTEHLRRQAFIRQEQMARSRAGMRLLHDGATYAQALESRIEREIEEQRQAEEAAALAKAKPKGPPAHLVGTEARPPFGGLAAGSQAAPEVTPTPVTQGRTSIVGGAPEVTTPLPGSGTLPRSSPTRPSSRPASSTAPALPASSSTSTPGTSSTAGPSPGQSGIFPPPTSPFPPVDRPGRAGYGTRNQSRRRDEPTNAWDAFRFPLHRPGADLRGTAVPHTVREWAADTWADAERLEAAIAAGVDISPQCVWAGVVFRSLPPTAQGGRLPREPPPGWDAVPRRPPAASGR